MSHIYVLNRHFYTRISYVLNEKRCYLTNTTYLKQRKRRYLSNGTQYCIVVIILANAKGVICHVTPFNAK